ncbi:MAG TPA: L-histidine N(alpha)-methyltransferase [Burkholderiales bacterium]|nr:L-histidine N(alpha)-methyltransferase [Burkholderiales bacterium]
MARKQRAGRLARLSRRGVVNFFGTAVGADGFLDDVISGLSQPHKALPPKYLYDAEGSRLFERICRLREYYLTRTELALTRRHLREILRFAGERCELIEYGSGESVKTRMLIEHLRPLRYVPVEISEASLREAAARLAREFPWLDIAAVMGDFSRPLKLAPPGRRKARRRVAYFPGSTIGNLSPAEAEGFLRMTRAQVGASGAMLVGVDLKKDPSVLHAAYNDAKGVTAAFNLNLLARINRELGGDFDLRRFRHYAFYNASRGRIEMHLVSLVRQSVRVGRSRFQFDAGETIHTENSWKYSVEEFQALAAEAGFRGARVWRDRRGLFSLHGLTAVG